MESLDHSSRPNFLSAIKTLKHTFRLPHRTKSQSDYSTSESSHSSSDLSRGSSRANSQLHVPSTDYYSAPRRQCSVPEMDDYLSLDQLEGLWQYQDSYVGPIPTPLAPSARVQCCQEPVEAPTFIQHKRPDNSSLPRGNSISNLGVPAASDEALIVDGRLHPAMRSAPNLELPPMDEPVERDLPLPPSDIADMPLPPSINRSRIANNDFPRLSSIGKPLVSKDGKPVLSRMGKPVPVPMPVPMSMANAKPNMSWTQRRQFLREEPGLI